jgi:predicted AAA+ superfamily ATPase
MDPELQKNQHVMQRIRKFKRELKLAWVPNPVNGSAAAFLWGPRQTGKTTLLHQQLPDARFYDLLDTGLAAELSARPT